MSQTTGTCLPERQVRMTVSAVCFPFPSHFIPAVTALGSHLYLFPGLLYYISNCFLSTFQSSLYDAAIIPRHVIIPQYKAILLSCSKCLKNSYNHSPN